LLLLSELQLIVVLLELEHLLLHLLLNALPRALLRAQLVVFRPVALEILLPLLEPVMQLLIVCLEPLDGRLILLEKVLGVFLVFRLCLTPCILLSGERGLLWLLIRRVWGAHLLGGCNH
jgi:hypothetical protein